MGVFLSTVWNKLFAKGEVKALLVGLDNAGKTTTLYKLVLDEVVSTAPTIGSNVEEVRYKNVKFVMWDLGGQESSRSAWSTYYADTHAVIMVIDSTDRKRLGTIHEELRGLVEHEQLKGALLLVYANKQDKPQAMSAAEITEALRLHSIQEHQWHIQACCALTGEGLAEGMDWIAENLKSK